ncbi:hypothetical protein MSHI_22420 [Mycobacterium shinjukuense]|uniref:Uncharacterized protein n=1 Tax=Mycobacterium shinjukuense TaxID=398694 RepID=A0A7I7MQI3_9MYCO|nr:hypothetical protein MSHI_22420 [Mycobacterium shinjukuense]
MRTDRRGCPRGIRPDGRQAVRAPVLPNHMLDDPPVTTERADNAATILSP